MSQVVVHASVVDSPPDPWLTIIVRGDLDSAAVPIVSDYFNGLTLPSLITLDLRQVTFCSSAGWRSIETVLLRAAHAGTTVEIKTSPAIERLVSILARITSGE